MDKNTCKVICKKIAIIVALVACVMLLGLVLWLSLGNLAPQRVEEVPVPMPSPMPATNLMRPAVIEDEFFRPGDRSDTDVVQLYQNEVVPSIGYIPGGREIRFFDKTEGRFFSLDIVTNRASPISPRIEGAVHAVQWSPNLTRAIVYFELSPGAGSPAVALVKVTETEREFNLINLDARIINFAWRRDDVLWGQLVTDDRNEFVRISLTDGTTLETALQIPGGVGWVASSFDRTGRYLVFSGVGFSPESRSIYLHDTERNTTTRLTTDGKSVLPIWSPDGEWIVFSYLTGSIETRDLKELKIMRRDGSEKRSLGVSLPAPQVAFISRDAIASAIAEKIPADCQAGILQDPMRADCFSYGDAITGNIIRIINLASPELASSIGANSFRSFGFPRVMNPTRLQNRNLLAFIDLRDNKIYAIGGLGR